MYEIKLDENVNLEKDIENSIQKKNKIITINYFIVVLNLLTISIMAISYFELYLRFKPLQLLIGTLAINTLIDSGLVLCGAISNKIISSKKKKSKTILSKVAAALSNNDIKTSAKELSESVIFERVNMLTETIIDEDLSTTRDDTQEDKCFVFLDHVSEIQGLLERTITTEIDDEKASETKYYVLEEPELREVVPRVEMVKKLVRKPNRNIDTKSKK